MTATAVCNSCAVTSENPFVSTSQAVMPRRAKTACFPGLNRAECCEGVRARAGGAFPFNPLVDGSSPSRPTIDAAFSFIARPRAKMPWHSSPRRLVIAPDPGTPGASSELAGSAALVTDDSCLALSLLRATSRN
jgi:hypothetical protein